jgi:hypothetical protein
MSLPQKKDVSSFNLLGCVITDTGTALCMCADREMCVDLESRKGTD